jgi:hypothetical protein
VVPLNKAETFIQQGDGHHADDQIKYAQYHLQDGLHKIDVPGGTAMPGAVAEKIQKVAVLYREQQTRLQQLKQQAVKMLDPNTPKSGQAREIYIKLGKEFKDTEAQMLGHVTSANELLQRCQGLPGNPGFQAKPDTAVTLVDKIDQALEKVEQKAADLVGAFGSDCDKVRKEAGSKAPAVVALEDMANQLGQKRSQISIVGRQCRQALHKALQHFKDSGNPAVQQLLAKLQHYV